MNTSRLIQSGEVTGGSSMDILTWMQILGKEELSTMKKALNIGRIGKH